MSLPLLPVLWMLSAPPAPSTGSEPLCVGRAPRELSETLDAGKDAQGQSLKVKHLTPLALEGPDSAALPSD